LAGNVGTRGPVLLAVETRESIGALKAAIAAGARGFYLWPGERDALAGAAAATVAQVGELERRARVFGVHAARGGAGATFVATHLARSFARSGASVVLVDGDAMFGDVGIALGAPIHDPPVDGSVDQPPTRTLGDLLPLEGEIAPHHVEQVLWDHTDGFRVLLAPRPEEAASLAPDDLGAALAATAACADVVLVQLPRALGALVRPVVTSLDRLIEVLTLDVSSFRAASRTIDALGADGLEDRVELVVNRATRGEIVVADVVRVFGRTPIAVFPHERTVARAQDHGELLPRRGRTSRAFDRLARRLRDGDA
jgi:Flp pilus assembly CpaE family ATPase